MLYRIVAPHYVAGLIIEANEVVEAAPILDWAVGKSWTYCYTYFKRKKFEVENLN